MRIMVLSNVRNLCAFASPLAEEDAADDVQHGSVERVTELEALLVRIVNCFDHVMQLFLYPIFDGSLADAEVSHGLRRHPAHAAPSLAVLQYHATW